MQQNNTAQAMNILNTRVRVEAISAARAKELIVLYKATCDVDDIISGLWSDFDPEKTESILDAAEKLEALR